MIKKTGEALSAQLRSSTANPKAKFFCAIQTEPISAQVIQIRFETIPIQDRLHPNSLKGHSKINFFLPALFTRANLEHC
jgi:hypothetical protein